MLPPRTWLTGFNIRELGEFLSAAGTPRCAVLGEHLELDGDGRGSGRRCGQ